MLNNPGQYQVLYLNFRKSKLIRLMGSTKHDKFNRMKEYFTGHLKAKRTHNSMNNEL